jgi:hypothetical protein
MFGRSHQSPRSITFRSKDKDRTTCQLENKRKNDDGWGTCAGGERKKQWEEIRKQAKKNKVVPGIEPGLPEESVTIRIRSDNRYTTQPIDDYLLMTNRRLRLAFD